MSTQITHSRTVEPARATIRRNMQIRRRCVRRLGPGWLRGVTGCVGRPRADDNWDMPAHVISEVEMLDETQGQRYRELAAASIARDGGRYLARGVLPEVPEGDWQATRRVVIVEFPTWSASGTGTRPLTTPRRWRSGGPPWNGDCCSSPAPPHQPDKAFPAAVPGGDSVLASLRALHRAVPARQGSQPRTKESGRQ